MKKFYIVANPDKENTKNMQTAVEEYLTTRGAKVSAGKSASGHGNPYTDPEDVKKRTQSQGAAREKRKYPHDTGSYL